MVNQVELHPLLPQAELRETHARYGIATEPWSPLGQGPLLAHPTVLSLSPWRTQPCSQLDATPCMSTMGGRAATAQPPIGVSGLIDSAA